MRYIYRIHYLKVYTYDIIFTGDSMKIILFNPLSNNGKSIKTLNKFLKRCDKYEVVDITNTDLMLYDFNDNDIVIIGGDGTLHTLLNILKERNIMNNIYLYKGGSGNDFSRDFKENYINITKYIKHTPNCNKKYFLTSTGFGVDGEVCLNVSMDKKSNYYKVAVKTIKKFKRFDLKLTIDNKEYYFKNVWFATVMNGCYFGGGMKLSPKSNRLDDQLEVVVIHKIGVFKLLSLFPTIFLGKHILFKKAVFTGKGKVIQLESNVPQVVQSDGELYGKEKTLSFKF